MLSKLSVFGARPRQREIHFVECGGKFFELQGLDKGLIERHFRKFLIRVLPDSPPSNPLQIFEFHQRGESYDLYVGGETVGLSLPLLYLVELTWSKIQTLVALSISELHFVRGDVLECQPGVGLFLAGPSFSGQTSLADALIELLSARRWSSFYGVLGSDGRAYRYPDLTSEAIKIEIVAKVAYRPGLDFSCSEPSPGQLALNLAPLVVVGDSESIGRTLPVLAKLSLDASRRFLGQRNEVEEAASFFASVWNELGR